MKNFETSVAEDPVSTEKVVDGVSQGQEGTLEGFKKEFELDAVGEQKLEGALKEEVMLSPEEVE